MNKSGWKCPQCSGEIAESFLHLDRRQRIARKRLGNLLRLIASGRFTGNPYFFPEVKDALLFLTGDSFGDLPPDGDRFGKYSS